MKTDMKDMSIFGATLQLDGTTVFLLIAGGIAIWLLMSFLFTSSNEEPVEVIVRTENTPLPKETKKPDRKKDEDEAKREALRRKKQRERRKEFIERLLSTLKKTAVLLLESSWMIGLSVAIILTVYFITQNMLIE
jgi:hypothetical protein